MGLMMGLVMGRPGLLLAHFREAPGSWPVQAVSALSPNRPADYSDVEAQPMPPRRVFAILPQ